MTLTPRDLALVAALCGPVRLFSWDQVRTWWPGAGTDPGADSASGRRAARRRLAVLVARRLLTRHRLSARPAVWPTGPVARWPAGGGGCDFDAVARVLAGRWRRPPVATTVYRATRRAVNLLGGVARHRPAPGYQASHDLGVSAVYLHYLRERRAEVVLWRGEDELPRRGAAAGRKRPDAVLHDGRRPVRAVEFGAAYPADRLRAFHDDCAGRTPPLPYEIW